MRVCKPEEAAALLRPKDRLAGQMGPGQPGVFLQALGERDDWKTLEVFTCFLSEPYRLFSRPGVSLLCPFFGPVERSLREAGADVAFLPGDFRRFTLFVDRFAPRVVATTATPPDADGWMSLSVSAGAMVNEIIRCGRDPERLLIVEANPRLPRTFGIPPDHPHGIHVDDVDVLIETDQDPFSIPDPEPGEVERAIAEHVSVYVSNGSTLQTGIGGIPGAVAGLLAEGPGGDYGVHSEMFTNGLMRLHKAGKVSNEHKGIFEGMSVTTIAMGSRELYEWLDGEESVRFLPVEWINTPSIIARNRNMRSINGALMLDLAGQVVADTIDGKQYSGIGGHEDFTSGASLESDDRSLICLPSTVSAGDRVLSRIVPTLGAGAVVTTPRHQLDIVVTEYGAAEVACLTVRDRARALAELAHPEFRPELRQAAEHLGF
jgi:acyl-CoA hydrolase